MMRTCGSCGAYVQEILTAADRAEARIRHFAPELLAALKVARERLYIHQSEGAKQTVALCDDAIAKAEAVVDPTPAQARARLIAAAPELLEACNSICEAMAFAPKEHLAAALDRSYNLCRAAVAKAEAV